MDRHEVVADVVDVVPSVEVIVNYANHVQVKVCFVHAERHIANCSNFILFVYSLEMN